MRCGVRSNLRSVSGRGCHSADPAAGFDCDSSACLPVSLLELQPAATRSTTPKVPLASIRRLGLSPIRNDATDTPPAVELTRFECWQIARNAHYRQAVPAHALAPDTRALKQHVDYQFHLVVEADRTRACRPESLNAQQVTVTCMSAQVFCLQSGSQHTVARTGTAARTNIRPCAAMEKLVWKIIALC